MTLDNNEKPSILYTLPTEVLVYIFANLSAKELWRLREVCARWRNIIDELTRSDVFWRGHCVRDFRTVCKVAKRKARVGMQWFNIYRSLSLWPRLHLARLIRDEFAYASRVIDEIQSFELLEGGIIGVLTRGSITYYDIETLELSKRRPISGDYMRYKETEDHIVIKSISLLLYVIRKRMHSPKHETNTTFDNVKLFLVIDDRSLYFVNLDNEVFECKLTGSNLSDTLLKTMGESVLCLGYTDKLNILTNQRKIYSITNGNLVVSCELDESSNLLHELYKYNLLENINWRIIYEWQFSFGHKVPEGPLQEVLVIRIYGDVVLVGCNWGVFRIYYKPFMDGEFDLYNAEPVKQYNFAERSDCPVLTMCPIIRVDVLEAEDGHTIVVGMPKKIAVLNFVHTFKRSASVAMLPYNDMKVKFIRMEDV